MGNLICCSFEKNKTLNKHIKLSSDNKDHLQTRNLLFPPHKLKFCNKYLKKSERVIDEKLEEAKCNAKFAYNFMNKSKGKGRHTREMT